MTMANKLQFKRGLKSNLPSSADSGMPLWCTDTKELYIGTGSGVQKIGDDNDGTTSIKTLSSSGTIALTDNSVNQINVTGNVTFNLPSITNKTIFHEIFILLKMNTVKTINLGTTYFFNAKTPNLSEAGLYSLIYEYDGTNWVCGAIKKGTAS
ncbi:hypothetical protein IJ182_09440 [bacterium]|nr:hypothetical protein [bacterium]